MIFTTIIDLDFDFHELIFEEKNSSTLVNKSLGLGRETKNKKGRETKTMRRRKKREQGLV